MTDEELIDYTDPDTIARQNIAPNAGCNIDGKFYDVRNLVHLASSQADRIEALTKERDQWISHAKNAIWADTEELKEAEAYAEELERELNTCRMAQAVMDNTVADLEGKLAKAAAFLEEIAITGDWFVSDMNDLIKELKGEKHD